MMIREDSVLPFLFALHPRRSKKGLESIDIAWVVSTYHFQKRIDCGAFMIRYRGLWKKGIPRERSKWRVGIR